MNWIFPQDALSLLFVLVIFVFVLMKTGRKIFKTPYNLLGFLLLLECFHYGSNAFEWSGIANNLDLLEDNVLVLQPVIWIFFIYALSDKVAQKEIEEREERYSLAQKGTNIGTWDWDLKTNVLIWSDQIEPMFGLDAGEFNQTFAAFFDLVHPDDRALIEDSVKICLSMDSAYDMEHRIVWKDGTVRWVHEKGFVTRDKKGKPIRMLGTVYDVTDQKNIEYELRLEKERAERFSRAKSQFIANISHDIRTPLNAVMGFTQLLQMTPLSEKQVEYVDVIKKRGEDLVALVEDVIDISKIESSELPIKKTEFDIVDLIEEAVSGTKMELGSKKVELSSVIDKNVPRMLIGDAIRIKQVFWNLLQNAAKYTDKGHIKFHLSVEARANKPSNAIILRASIKDTGIGIPNDKLDLVFEPFVDFTDVTGATAQSSSGLGLYISKTLVKLIGGTISVTSKEGLGTEFIVTLNLEQVEK